MSHETIYLTLFIQARGGLKRELTQHLRTRRANRRPKGARPPSGKGPDRRPGHDLGAARCGGGPGGARPLGRRPDHGQTPDRDRHPGGTLVPLRDAVPTPATATPPNRCGSPSKRP